MSRKLVILALIVLFLTFGLTGCSMFNRGPEIDNWQPNVSPQADKMLFSKKDGDGFEIYQSDLDGKNLVKITDDDYNNWNAVWAPDGNRIAFVSSRDDNTDIYMINLDGSKERRLTTDSGQDVNPSWGKSGAIMFNSDRSGEWEIYELQISEGTVTQISRSSEQD